MSKVYKLKLLDKLLDQPSFDIDGVTYTASLTLRIAQASGYRCALCDRRATWAMLTVDKDGIPIIRLHVSADNYLTKDHIVPISKGGRTELSNLQTLCLFCNQKKGSDVLFPSSVRSKYRPIDRLIRETQ